MSLLLNIGEADFAALRSNNAYYADKTKILHELVRDTGNKVTLFTRPRRFGKTLMMSMMENFFSIRKDSREIFDGLAVAEDTDFCHKWMNRYPVLFISFKDVEGENFEGAYGMLKNKIADVCKDFAPVFQDAPVDKDDLNIFLNLKATNTDESKVKTALKTLMRMLQKVYGKPVILLIDEYDVPLAKASEKSDKDSDYYERMLDLIKGLMSSALKDNEFLKFAVITGCLRIAKESIFTGANNFAAYSILDDEFSDYFGFTDAEVTDILIKAGRGDKADVVREWYDGYNFGNSRVYCPWDVISYVAALQKNKDAKPKNYWKNTSHNGILLTFAKRTDFCVSGKFETLLNGGTITQPITDELTYGSLESSEDNLWSVILMTGYVTQAGELSDGEGIKLRIPNREIASIFEDTVVRLFRETLDTAEQKAMMDALWKGDEAEVSRCLSEFLWKTISYNDYHEDYYHAFLAGIFVGLGYEVESNKEKGLGRPDILLKDLNNRRAIIIEAKIAKRAEDMDAECQDAISQIIKRRYTEGLYGYKDIWSYGVSFFQKQAQAKLFSHSEKTS